MQDAALPEASVAVNVITVVPAPDTMVPAVGDCVTEMDPLAVQLSLLVASDVYEGSDAVPPEPS